jgi:UDP-N-acetylmuramate--alanine ligase
MSKIDFNTIKKIHFIGIGGIGMSALARFFLYEKKQVSGSDRASSMITDALEKEGVKFFVGQSAENISNDSDLIVYTEAMAKDHEEMLAGQALGVPMMNYFEALGLVVNPYYLIAVSGSHGKTTTTAMLTDVLEEAGLDPTAVIGSLRSKTGSNFRAGKSKYAVVEACEYKRDFLHLEPDILVITNVEFEHVDYYKELADVQSAFKTLAQKVPAEGFVVADTSHTNIKPILEGVKAKVIDYKNWLDLNLALRQPGLHNRLNAGAVSAVADILQIAKNISNKALENFAGTWRRFEYKGVFKNNKGEEVIVYDDYAHHPTEISATISGVRELYPNKKLTLVFQSHTYSRTAELFSDFVSSLTKADEVILLPIYAAREENIYGVSSEKMVEMIKENGGKAVVVNDSEEAIVYIKNKDLVEGVIVTMGAGDMTSKVGEGLVRG